MFADGFYNSKAVLKSLKFQHSYSNPIWGSDWHFYNAYPGESHSDFVNRFDKNKMFREISESDIACLKDTLTRYGKAYRRPDLEAIEETEQVITFCEKYINTPDHIIIYESEL